MRKILTTLGVCAAVSLSPQMASATGSGSIPILDFAAGLLNVPNFPQSENYTTNDDIVINTYDGLNLTANIFVPNDIQGSAPAIIFINSWAMNEYQYLQQAAELADKGYIVLSYATRGFGQSEGFIGTAGPDDIQDYSTVIDYLIANYPVDENAIASAGISYGSGISLIGAAQDPRVKAIAAMSSWGDLVDALYGNQSPRLVWGELLNLAGELTGNPDPSIAENWDIVKNQKLDQIDQVIDWASVRSPINYVDQLNENGTAVYLAKAYGDNLFQPNTLLDMFGQLTTPKYIDLVPGTHATAELLPSLVGIGDNLIWENVYKWFDIHLKGETNELSNAKAVNMKVRFQDSFDQFDDYPLAETSDVNYYLHPRSSFDDGDMETKQYWSWFNMETDDSINGWFGTSFSTGIPILSDLLEQVDVPVITNIYAESDYRAIYWKSDTLSNDMQIRGTPSVSLRVQPHYNKVQLIAYLYDVDAWGTSKLITHGVITLPDANWGAKVRVDFDMITTAYDVPAGHRLAIAIDTKDPYYKSPTTADFYLDFQYKTSEQNVVTIPTL